MKKHFSWVCPTGGKPGEFSRHHGLPVREPCARYLMDTSFVMVNRQKGDELVIQRNKFARNRHHQGLKLC